MKVNSKLAFFENAKTFYFTAFNEDSKMVLTTAIPLETFVEALNGKGHAQADVRLYFGTEYEKVEYPEPKVRDFVVFVREFSPDGSKLVSRAQVQEWMKLQNTNKFIVLNETGWEWQAKAWYKMEKNRDGEWIVKVQFKQKG